MDSKQLKQSIKRFNADIKYVPYERPIVAAVDKLLELSKQRGYPQIVSSDKDWEIIEFMIKIFATLYPEHWADFQRKQKEMKAAQKNKHASNREKGGAEVRHLLEIPKPLAEMIMKMFPMQRLQDKKFATEFARRLPLFRWADTL